jgi:tRNA dimethylallyltransferase
MSDLQGKAKNVLPFRLIAFSLMPQDRGALHRRIAERFDRMLADGLVAEVESLKERYRLRAELPSMRCVGYRQIWSYLAGEYDDDTMRERAIAATRQLAKRQLTWLRSLKEVEPVVSDAARLASRLAA